MRRLGDRHGVSVSLMGLGGSALFQRLYMRAALLLAASEALRQAVSTPLAAYIQAEFDAFVDDLRRQLGDKVFQAEWERGHSLALDQMLAFAFSKSEIDHTA